jgi:hypothetical protein
MHECVSIFNTENLEWTAPLLKVTPCSVVSAITIKDESEYLFANRSEILRINLIGAQILQSKKIFEKSHIISIKKIN